VLKIGRSKRHIRKDYGTYFQLPQNIRNRLRGRIPRVQQETPGEQDLALFVVGLGTAVYLALKGSAPVPIDVAIPVELAQTLGK